MTDDTAVNDMEVTQDETETSETSSMIYLSIL